MDRREFLGAALAAAPALWGSAPIRRREPLALVTADTEAHVVVVGLRSGRVAARLRTLEAPRSIEACPGGRAVVAHTTEGALTLLEGRPVAVRRRLRGLGVPRYTAASPDGRHAWVTDSLRGEIVVVDLVRGRVVGGAEVGAHARHVAVSPSGRTLWIALGSKAPALAVVDVSDPVRPRLRRRIRPPFLAHDVGFAPGGGRVWVTSGDRRLIAVYAAHGSRPLRVLPADAPPQHVTFGDRVAYVASGDSGTLRVHALAGGGVARRSPIPLGSYNVQRGGGRVLTPSLAHGTLTVLAPSGAVLARWRVARAAHDAAHFAWRGYPFNSGGGSPWALCGR
jgi:DNA-binding beta-propeller fold protein YncE